MEWIYSFTTLDLRTLETSFRTPTNGNTSFICCFLFYYISIWIQFFISLSLSKSWYIRTFDFCIFGNNCFLSLSKIPQLGSLRNKSFKFKENISSQGMVVTCHISDFDITRIILRPHELNIVNQLVDLYFLLFVNITGYWKNRLAHTRQIIIADWLFFQRAAFKENISSQGMVVTCHISDFDITRIILRPLSALSLDEGLNLTRQSEASN
jgi:hypothetical protein